MAAAPEQQHRRRDNRCNSDVAERGMGSGVLETMGRVCRRSSAAGVSAILGAHPALAENSDEREGGGLGSHRQENSWQSLLSRRDCGRDEEEGNAIREEDGVGLMDGASAGPGDKQVFGYRARRSKSRLRHGLRGYGDGRGGGSDGEEDGDGVDLHDDTTQLRGAAVGARSSRDGNRRRGVDEVRTSPLQLKLQRACTRLWVLSARACTGL